LYAFDARDLSYKVKQKENVFVVDEKLIEALLLGKKNAR
jgi:hypothetical protein